MYFRFFFSNNVIEAESRLSLISNFPSFSESQRELLLCARNWKCSHHGHRSVMWGMLRPNDYARIAVLQEAIEKRSKVLPLVVVVVFFFFFFSPESGVLPSSVVIFAAYVCTCVDTKSRSFLSLSFPFLLFWLRLNVFFVFIFFLSKGKPLFFFFVNLAERRSQHEAKNQRAVQRLISLAL